MSLILKNEGKLLAHSISKFETRMAFRRKKKISNKCAEASFFHMTMTLKIITLIVSPMVTDSFSEWCPYLLI